jgi:glycosyltransferase involved in cell wall biosynthesis
MKTDRLAFVTPRYGDNILGGAETAVRTLAEILAAEGMEVEVFTSCATNLFDWRNTLPAGRETLRGVTVHRFPIVWQQQQRHVELFARILHNVKLTVDEQFEWVTTGPQSPALYRALAGRNDDFNLFFFAPYPFPMIHCAAGIAPAKSVIWPCLHDEAYAYLAPTHLMLQESRGLLFNSLPEARLAVEQLKIKHPRKHVVGIPVMPMNANGARFRQAAGLHDPYVLYAGRIEGSKNVPLLIEYFIDYKTRHPGPLKLVLMGDGPSKKLHPDLVYLGFQRPEDKADVYGAAIALCQPSLNESFSIVIMESWLAGRPVMVHCECPVTRHHVVESGGGLYFCNYEEFDAGLTRLIEDEPLNRRMGEAGRQYVVTQHGPAAVSARFHAALQDWLPEEPA